MATAVATPPAPPPRPRLIGRTRRRLVRLWKDTVWSQLDLLIVFNLVLLGVEIENDEVLGLWRVLICILYLIEMIARLFFLGRWHFLMHPRHSMELCIVALACGCVLFLGGEPGWMWRLTVLRVFRLARIEKMAQHWFPAKDLWLIIVGLKASLKSLVWAGLVFFLVIFGCAGAAVGLVGLRKDEDGHACSVEDRDRGECIDEKELFGSVPRAMLTLFQLATRDGWADVARGLSARRPLASVFLTAFVVVLAYGLASVVVGMLVKETLKLARTHSMHGTQKGITEDIKTVGALKAFLDDALLVDERTTLRLLDLKEFLNIPIVSRSLESLELPFERPEDLWTHLDVHKQGELTTQELCDGLLLMRRPSNANDMTALTARIGGSVTYVKRMGFRAERLRGNLHDLRHVLGASFEELARLAEPNEDSVAEVSLRAQGIIKNAVPPAPPRYTM